MDECAQKEIPPPSGIDVEREKLADFQRRCAEGLKRQLEIHHENEQSADSETAR